MKYTVVAVLDASSVVNVEADSPAAALEEAQKRVCTTICAQCSRDVQLGDILRWLVIDENGKTVHDDKA